MTETTSNPTDRYTLICLNDGTDEVFNLCSYTGTYSELLDQLTADYLDEADTEGEFGQSLSEYLEARFYQLIPATVLPEAEVSRLIDLQNDTCTVIFNPDQTAEQLIFTLTH